jgi:hypothetical protein
MCVNANIVNPNPMRTEIKLPKTLETYVHAINMRDEQSFSASFHQDATVKDVGREIRGLTAITEWARREIFAVNVSLELMNARECEGQTIITVKVDGTFDRTGLPDPLIMEHCFTIVGGKIAALSCQLAGHKVS